MTTLTRLHGLVSEDVLAAHLQEIIVEYDSYKKKLRRSEAREAVSIPIEATLLDDDFQTISAPFHMVTRDMSTRGVGVFHDKQIPTTFLHLKFQSPVTFDEFGVTAKVEHCTPCGRYFIIGCRFLTDQVQTTLGTT